MTVKELFEKAGYPVVPGTTALKASDPKNIILFTQGTVHLWDPIFNKGGWEQPGARLEYRYVRGWEHQPDILHADAEAHSHLLPPEVLERAGALPAAGGVQDGH